MPQRLRHLVVASSERCAPAVKAERQLAVHHTAQPLAQLQHELRALIRHLCPRAQASRQTTVQHVVEALAHRLALCLCILPLRQPRRPAAGELTVNEVPQCLRHWFVLKSERRTPRPKPESQLAVDHPAQGLAQLVQSFGPLCDDELPRAPRFGLPSVHQMAEAPSEVLDLSHRRTPRSHAVGKLAIQHKAQALAQQPESLEPLTIDLPPPLPSFYERTVKKVLRDPLHVSVRLETHVPAVEGKRHLAVRHPAAGLA